MNKEIPHFMNIMDSTLTSFCVTCLSKGRLLYPAHILSLKLENLNLGLKIKETSGICWECRALIKKFYKFKAQVIAAQNALTQVLKCENLESLSHLSHCNKYLYDLDIQFDEPLINLEVEDKHVMLKLEMNPDVFDEEPTDCDVINDTCVLSDITTVKQEYEDETINSNINDTNMLIGEKPDIEYSRKSKHRRKGISISRQDISNSDDVKGKFETVIFKEEEMLRNREVKRSGPNFKKIPYKCDTCVLGFTRRETYDVHIKKKHDEKAGKHVCGVCQCRFPTGFLLHRHRKKHYIIHRCLLCDYDSLELWSIVSHCRTKHSEDSNGSIHCRQCEDVFSSPEALSEHMKEVHSLYCSECGDKFKCRSSLRSHKIRVHGSRRDFICDSCGKTFKTKSRLESHVVRHSSALAKKLAYCTICKIQYKNIYVYRNHLQNSPNHSERTYECEECKKKFASKIYWRKHCEFYHLHKSQFKCDMCNKLFITQWKLNNHRQIHHDVGRSRNHACNVCGKKFFTLSTLRGHQLTHSETRSYMCEDCGDTFKQRPALYTHTRLVHRGGKRK